MGFSMKRAVQSRRQTIQQLLSCSTTHVPHGPPLKSPVFIIHHRRDIMFRDESGQTGRPIYGGILEVVLCVRTSKG